MHHAWADTTGALRSSRTMMVRPFSSVVMATPGGSVGIFIAATRVEKEVSLIVIKSDRENMLKSVLSNPIRSGRAPGKRGYDRRSELVHSATGLVSGWDFCDGQNGLRKASVKS